MVFHNGHFRTDGIVEVGKFHPDGSRTHNDQSLGLVFQGHGLTVSNDVFSILWNRWQLAASSTGGNDDVIGTEGLLLAGLIRYLQLFAGQQLPVAHDDVNLVLFHQELNAFRHAFSHTSAALNHAAEIGLRSCYRDAVVFRVLDVFKNVCALQQSFGGDASPIQANAAQGFSFHYSCFQSQLACANGRDVSAGAASKYNDVVFHG